MSDDDLERIVADLSGLPERRVRLSREFRDLAGSEALDRFGDLTPAERGAFRDAFADVARGEAKLENLPYGQAMQRRLDRALLLAGEALAEAEGRRSPAARELLRMAAAARGRIERRDAETFPQGKPSQFLKCRCGPMPEGG